MTRHCAIINLGCKVNRVEADSFAWSLTRQGWVIDSNPQAELALVNTCLVTAEAEKKSRKTIRRTLQDYPQATVVITGCVAALRKDELEALSPRIRVIDKASLEALVSNPDQFAALISNDLQLEDRTHKDQAETDSSSIPTPTTSWNADTNPGNSTSSEIFEGRLRRGIKVQDGCSHSCTYCIVHIARGPSRSLPSEVITKSFDELRAENVPEIVLTGINLGAWSEQRQTSTVGLAQLVKELLERPSAQEEPLTLNQPSFRLRLSSIEPMDIDDDLIELLSQSNGKLCRHLHLPLQSGSSRVLQEMNRPYSAEDYLDLVQRLRMAVPSLSLSTDIIAGFPGETVSDFEETLALAQACGFSKIHCFPFSPRKGTPAFERPDGIAPQLRQERASTLRRLGDHLAIKDWQSRQGHPEWALVERPGRARLESYHEIAVPQTLSPGSFILVDPGDYQRFGD